MVGSICPLPHIKSLTPISEKLCIGLSLIPRKIRIFRPLINSNFPDYPSATSVLFSPGLWSKFIFKWTQKSAVCHLNKGLSCPENTPNSRHSKRTFFFPLTVKFNTDTKKGSVCDIQAVSGIMNRHMSGWSMKSTHCKRCAWGDTLFWASAQICPGMT